MKKKERTEIESTNRSSNYLYRVYFYIGMLGILFTVRQWLVSVSSKSFMLPVICTIFIVLISCLFSAEIIQILKNQTDIKSGSDEKKFLLSVCRQLKKMDTDIPQKIQDSNTASYKILEVQCKDMLDDVKKQQLLASKAIIKKLEDKINQLETINASCLELLQKQAEENQELKSYMHTIIESSRTEINVTSLSEQDKIEETVGVDDPEQVAMMGLPDVNDESYDPNKQLTPEEIAAMFASVN